MEKIKKPLLDDDLKAMCNACMNRGVMIDTDVSTKDDLIAFIFDDWRNMNKVTVLVDIRSIKVEELK